MPFDENSSLEEDWLDQTVEPPTPAQPMVVIHYRNRGVPLWVLIPVIFIVPIGGILVYDRYFVEADHVAAVDVRRAPQDKVAGQQLDAPLQVAVEPPPPVVVKPQPLASTLTQTTTTSQTSPPPSNPAAADSKPAAPPATIPAKTVSVPSLPTDAGRAETTSKASQSTRSNPDSTVSADKPPSSDSSLEARSVPIAAGKSQVQSPVGDPVSSAKESTTTAAMVTDRGAGDGTALKAASEPARVRDDQQVQPTPKGQTDDSSRIVAMASEPAPVLTEPKSVRPVQEALTNKRAELASHVYEERVKFRGKVKEALSLNIVQAGLEIESLSRQDRQDRDPDKLAQARKAWFFKRMTLQAKVKLVRSLGLHESVILEFISTDLRPLIGTRNGPRDLNEVHVRAARLLLNHDLPAQPVTAVASSRPSSTDEPPTAENAPSGGNWLFRPERDTFRSDSLLDLRSLNEKVAGQSGFVRLAPDGDSFVLGDGTPIRFWSVASDNRSDQLVNVAAHHARFLAKRGVNMVRLFRTLHSSAKNARITDTDPKSIDATCKFVTALKNEGIYVTLTLYWGQSFTVPPQWGLEGVTNKDNPWGLLFFNPKLQQAYKAWLKALLARPNPYTGVPLANEPALAVIQLQNEDSLLFYTAQQIKGKQAELLGRQFGDWLKTKYGTLDDAFRAWGNDKVNEDRPDQGVVGLLLVWEWTQSRQGGRKKRLDDQLEFYADTMYRFNREIERYLHEELGCKQLVNAGNWKSVDGVKVDDAERWSYTANEVLAVNRYYSPIHKGPSSGWRIDPGDVFEDTSVLFHPRDLPLNLKQADGHPMMITETQWVPPLGYQSEGPFLTAAYQSLGGVDVVDWAGTNVPEWLNQDRSEWDAASRAKWQIATPMILGQFPAAALLFRKGYLEQGAPVVQEHRSLRQIWERVPPIIAEDPSYDPNRDMGDSARPTGHVGQVDPLAFLVGPVRVNYDSDPSKTKVADLRNFIDHDRKVVRGNTGQVSLDFGRGLCTIDAPRAQGACGFLNKFKLIELSSVSLRSENHYASVLIVSMDGEILSKSKRVLVQVGTRARPNGWVEREATFTAGQDKHNVHGKRVVSTGRMPWAIEDTSITLEVKNPGLMKATSLDLNGIARGSVKVADTGQAISLNLPRDALYVLLESD